MAQTVVPHGSLPLTATPPNPAGTQIRIFVGLANVGDLIPYTTPTAASIWTTISYFVSRWRKHDTGSRYIDIEFSTGILLENLFLDLYAPSFMLTYEMLGCVDGTIMIITSIRPFLHTDPQILVFCCALHDCQFRAATLPPLQHHIRTKHAEGTTFVCPHPGCTTSFDALDQEYMTHLSICTGSGRETREHLSLFTPTSKDSSMMSTGRKHSSITPGSVTAGSSGLSNQQQTSTPASLTEQTSNILPQTQTRSLLHSHDPPHPQSVQPTSPRLTTKSHPSAQHTTQTARPPDQKSSPDVTRLACDFEGCKWRTTIWSELVVHWNTTHDTQGLFCCPYYGCGGLFENFGDYIQHQRDEHDSHVIRRRRVGVEEIERRKKRLRDNQRVRKLYKISEKDGDAYPCDFEGCGSRFYTWGMILRHFEDVHQTGGLFCCPYTLCDGIFGTADDYDKHLEDHGGYQVKRKRLPWAEVSRRRAILRLRDDMLRLGKKTIVQGAVLFKVHQS